MSIKSFLLGFGFFVVIVSYLFYKPMPPSMAEPWAVRAYTGFGEFTMDTGFFLRKFGFSFWPNVTRNLQSYGTSLLLSKAHPDGITIKDEIFDGIPVRTYQPPVSGKELTGAVVYYHGGGWIGGSLSMYEPVMIALAMDTGLLVVSVDYRRVPEVVYPVPLDDCVKATVHFAKHAGQNNVDPNRIVIMGDSAGGNLAAAVALRLTQLESVPKVAAQVLIYPVLQAFDFRLPSFLNNVWNIFLTSMAVPRHQLVYMGIEEDDELVEAMLANNHTSADMKMEYTHVFDVNLLPETCQSDKYQLSFHEGIPEVIARLKDKITNPYIWPLMAPPELIKKLPRTYILSAGFDPLRSEGILYAKKLEKEGVYVELADYPNGYHPMMLQVGGKLEIKLARQAFEDIVIFVKKTVRAT